MNLNVEIAFGELEIPTTNINKLKKLKTFCNDLCDEKFLHNRNRICSDTIIRNLLLHIAISKIILSNFLCPGSDGTCEN